MDVSKIGQWARQVRALASVPTRAALRAAPGIRDLVENMFASGSDAYGEAWAPLAPSTLARGRRPPPLTDTGAMRGAVGVVPMAGVAGVLVSIPHPAGVHQTGSRRMPARQLMPSKGLPQSWREVLVDAVTGAVREGT